LPVPAVTYHQLYNKIHNANADNVTS